MLAKRFAEFLLKERWRAYMFALLFSALPFFGWLSAVIVGLITLRRGAIEGLVVLLWSLLPALIMTFQGNWIPFVTYVVFGSLLVWLMAMVLRKTSSWSLVVQLIALYGLAAVLLMHAFVPDVHTWWVSHLTSNMQNAEQQVGVKVKAAELKEAIDKFATMATGKVTMYFSLTAFIQLFFARGWEALTWEPGKLNSEAKRIRMGIFFCVLFAICLMLLKSGSLVYLDMLPVFALAFVIAGVSLVHSLLVNKGVPHVAFVFFYLLVIILALLAQFVLAVFAIVALCDSFFNFRLRFGKPVAKKT